MCNTNLFIGIRYHIDNGEVTRGERLYMDVKLERLLYEKRYAFFVAYVYTNVQLVYKDTRGENDLLSNLTINKNVKLEQWRKQSVSFQFLSYSFTRFNLNIALVVGLRHPFRYSIYRVHEYLTLVD